MKSTVEKLSRPGFASMWRCPSRNCSRTSTGPTRSSPSRSGSPASVPARRGKLLEAVSAAVRCVWSRSSTTRCPAATAKLSPPRR